MTKFKHHFLILLSVLALPTVTFAHIGTDATHQHSGSHAGVFHNISGIEYLGLFLILLILAKLIIGRVTKMKA